jgi:hypothetical protein
VSDRPATAKAAPTPHDRRRPALQRAAALRPARRFVPLADIAGPERHQRLTLIEFTWDVSGGVQPVILASRELLH